MKNRRVTKLTTNEMTISRIAAKEVVVPAKRMSALCTTSAISVASAEEITDDQPLSLCHGANYHVKLACVTLSRGAKGPDDFLKGYLTPSAPAMLIKLR